MKDLLKTLAIQFAVLAFSAIVWFSWGGIHNEIGSFLFCLIFIACSDMVIKAVRKMKKVKKN